jgi:predicted glycosyltransferase
MPALKMDSEFKSVQTVDEEADLESHLEAEGTTAASSLFHDLQPEVILVEMFPFGRKRFCPRAAAHARGQPLPAQTGTDPVQRSRYTGGKGRPGNFEKKVLKWLNAYFDGVLVHSDPALISLNQTFARVGDIACPLWYTGYVAQGSTAPGPGRGTPQIWGLTGRGDPDYSRQRRQRHGGW